MRRRRCDFHRRWVHGFELQLDRLFAGGLHSLFVIADNQGLIVAFALLCVAETEECPCGIGCLGVCFWYSRVRLSRM
jgi:hypothetical protein